MEMVITAELDMAHSEPTLEDAIADTIKLFPGLSIVQTGKVGGGGWPVVRLVGPFKTVLDALVGEGGWCLSEEPDALIAHMRELRPFEL